MDIVISNKILKHLKSPLIIIRDNKEIFKNKAYINLGISINNLNLYKKLENFFVPEKENWFVNKQGKFKVALQLDKLIYFQLEVDKIEDFYVIIFYDITNEIEYEKQLEELLYIDIMTKFPNRKKLIDDLRNEKLQITSLALLDIGGFKEINDFYGNKVGDIILRDVADIIYSFIKDKSYLKLYKFPADVYCIANSNNDENEFLNIVKNIIEYINNKVFDGGADYEIDVRIIAGLSFSPKNNKLITADLALQAAKENHKDYLVFYEELDNLREYKNNMEWAKKVKNALMQDNIVVYYQPLVNNETLNVDKYECLVRMIDGEKIVSPFFFLEISKKANLYHKITRVVIQKALKTFANLDFEFSLNVSYEDISENDFLDFIKEQFKLYPNISKRVVWEILEDEGIKNYDILINFTNEVKKMGCKIAIDDFGSGYSNFEHILKVKADYLKIDASLVKNIILDENSEKITKTIIEFAKSLNLKTIAEYVESKEIFEKLRKMGANYSQGYFFSAPISSPSISSYKGII